MFGLWWDVQPAQVAYLPRHLQMWQMSLGLFVCLISPCQLPLPLNQATVYPLVTNHPISC